MEGGTIPTNITLYLMLAICIVLVSVDIIEMIKLISAWTVKDKIEPLFFDSCIKVDLLVKTAFSVFSLLAALSAFILVSMMIMSLEFFIEKLMQPFLYLNYNIFGLYMLGFSLFGIIHWNEVAFMCDKKNPDEKIFSVGNMFSLIGCFALSLVITFGVTIFQTVTKFSDSILRRENGSPIIRSIFWWFVFRGRGNENIQPHPVNNNNLVEENNIISNSHQEGGDLIDNANDVNVEIKSSEENK